METESANILETCYGNGLKLHKYLHHTGLSNYATKPFAAIFGSFGVSVNLGKNNYCTIPPKMADLAKIIKN